MAFDKIFGPRSVLRRLQFLENRVRNIEINGGTGGGPGTTPTGLEAIDEGNGIGWRFIGRDPANYENIGLNAVDFSINTLPYLTKVGSTAEGTATFGFHNENRADASIMGGFNNIVSAAPFSYSSFVYGANNLADGSLGSMTVGTALINRNAWGCVVIGKANEEIAGSGGAIAGNDTDPLFIIGNGLIGNAFDGGGNFIGYEATLRRNALVVRRGGQLEAPSLTPDKIEAGDNKTLITKEYLETSATKSIVGYDIHAVSLTGSQVDQDSGLLEIGKTYIVDFTEAGDDFSNVGWVSDGVEFVATGTTPTSWANSSFVINITDSAPTSTILKNSFSGVNFTYKYDYSNGYIMIADQPIFTDINSVIINNFGSQSFYISPTEISINSFVLNKTLIELRVY